MKWLLLGLLFFLIATRRHLVAGLLSAVRRLPAAYRGGKRGAEDPAANAKDVTDR